MHASRKMRYPAPAVFTATNPHADVARIANRPNAAIKWAQSLGFRLGQMSDLLSIGQSHLRGRRTRVRALVRTKLTELDDALHELKSMRSALLAIAACQCGGDCPILEKALATPAATSVRRPLRRPR